MHFPVYLISIFIHILIKRHFPLLKRVNEKNVWNFGARLKKTAKKAPANSAEALSKLLWFLLWIAAPNDYKWYNPCCNCGYQLAAAMVSFSLAAEGSAAVR